MTEQIDDYFARLLVTAIKQIIRFNTKVAVRVRKASDTLAIIPRSLLQALIKAVA